MLTMLRTTLLLAAVLCAHVGLSQLSIEATDEGGQTASVSFEILDHPASCGCTYPQAFNYDLNADVDNGSCVFASDQSCLGDIVPDGVVGTNDLLQLLVEFGEVCE